MTTNAYREVIGAIRGWVAPTVAVGARRISAADIDGLRPEEFTSARTMAPRRLAEFATGRALLRDVTGVTEAITVGRHGAPALPAGVVASLAHDGEVAIVVATRDPQIAALGIDLEPAAAVTSDIADIVRRPDEHDVPLGATVVAKEAVYKAWSALGGDVLEHADIRVTIAGSAYVAQIVASGEVLHGRLGLVGAWWVAVVTAQAGP